MKWMFANKPKMAEEFASHMSKKEIKSLPETKMRAMKNVLVKLK
jgi:hypothetical protein